MGDPVSLVTNKPDSELAAEYKERMSEALNAVCAIINEAKTQGLTITYGTGDGPMGKHIISGLTVARHY